MKVVDTMASKPGIWKRIFRLFSQWRKPAERDKSLGQQEKEINAVISDVHTQISKAEDSAASSVSQLLMARERTADKQAEVDKWAEEARAASKTADKKRAAGKTSDADNADEKARAALSRQVRAEKELADLQALEQREQDNRDALMASLTKMRRKSEEMTKKRDELTMRARNVRANSQVLQASRAAEDSSANQRMRDFENTVRSTEYANKGRQEMDTQNISRMDEAQQHDEWIRQFDSIRRH